ncbi:hypothetical protein BGX12_11476 [Fibrobacter sp. UWR4]|nr:hypothetical protein BGX12_11476 [Fibrobacter sp. UWR4]PZW69036.1 hypothetical protein C8E88_101770 [Fibrobacter sp. UWR1]
MSIISRKFEDRCLRYEFSRVRRSRLFLSTVYFLLSTILSACDFQGPWSYYPEETEVYQGIYTFGYIVADESPYVCFSKVYGLTESSAENFAFYDSADVSVSGVFSPEVEADSETVRLTPLESSGKPNCFAYNRRCLVIGDEVSCVGESKVGVAGESYTLNAVFKWDSAGHKVTTEMKAVAKIPTKIHAKGVIPPSARNDAEFVENDYRRLSFEFLGFPYDILTYKIPMEYDESVRGVQMTLKYDTANGGESMNTTMMNMLSAFTEPDSMGYAYMSTKRPIENTASMGFTTRMMFAGRNTLDTMEYPGMTMPIGKSVIRFYATDQAYSDYRNTVLDAIEDPRVVPKSNVENGMGVFAGMLKDSLLMEVTTDEFVPFEYMARENCFREGGMGEHKPFETKWCRLNKKDVCVATAGGWSNLRLTSVHPRCVAAYVGLLIWYEPEVEQWQNEIDRLAKRDDEWWGDASRREKVVKQKDEINAEALLSYCMEYNFENNSVASCDALREQCQGSLEKTACKDSLWQWCSDRDWNIEKYKQCGTALVSRYYLEKMESPILKRVVDLWCEEHPEDKQCKR